jgi:hypothetical protein
MKFVVTAAGQRLGEGSVFRADAVQQEEKQELVCNFITITSKIFPGGKVQLGRDIDPSPPSSAEVKNRVELYLYSP